MSGSGLIEIDAVELANRLAAGQFSQTLFDVRTATENSIARIAAGRLLTATIAAEIEALDRSTPLAFY